MRPAASSRPRAPAGRNPGANPTARSRAQDSEHSDEARAPSKSRFSHPPALRLGERRNNRDRMTDVQSFTPSREDFSALLDESFGGRDFMEGSVVQGVVVAADRGYVDVDGGLKTEGRIPT